MANEDNQSRRERRKEARLSKNKKKYDSWLQHHQNSLKNEKIQQGIVAPKNSTDLFKDSVSDPEYDIDPSPVVENSEVQAKIHTSGKICKKKQSSDVNLVGELVGRSGKKTDPLPASCNVSNHTEDSDRLKKLTKKKRKKTRFEEYFDLENGIIPADEDLALEKRLAKKLKVKGGKLKGDDDGINMLFDEIPSALELFEDEELQSAAKSAPKAPDKTLHKKSKHLKSSKQRHVIEGEQEQDQRSVKTTDKEFEASFPPTTSCIDVELGKHSAQTALGGNTTKYIAPHKRSQMGSESQDNAQIRKQVRGLLNRLSESNVESITAEMSTIIHMGGRSLGSLIICEEVLASCSAGPRGNEQYAAVFAAFVAGMSCLVGIDFGAKILASLAKRFEEEYLKEDNMSLRNLTLLFSYLYIFGVFSSDLIYDFLVMLSKRLTEVDVSTILAVLQSCGMKLRGDDPIAMKNFINSIQSRVNELKTLSRDAQSSKRMEFMLQTICEIKNNKKRQKEETVQLTRIKKWLQKLRVDDILLRGLKWCKLLDGEKKGLWWLSGGVNVNSDQKNIREVANTIDMEVLEAQKMLQLAATQRMNTDARRAIFCVIMSGEDYIDAFEKLLRLDLPGKQDREVMRVLVECCLQEKVFNKYYCALASKLCSHDKNHKFTLQYCLWDKFKEVESMELIRSMHLSKFVAEMLACFALSLSVLKAVDLGDITELTPKKIMHFRMLFEAIFEFPAELVWNIFTRIALPEYETLCNGIVIFIREYVAAGQKSLAAKFKIAKKALNNIEGVLM